MFACADLKVEPELSDDHAAGDGPRSCDLGTKQLTRLSRSGGAVGREGGLNPCPGWRLMSEANFINLSVSTVEYIKLSVIVKLTRYL